MSKPGAIQVVKLEIINEARTKTNHQIDVQGSKHAKRTGNKTFNVTSLFFSSWKFKVGEFLSYLSFGVFLCHNSILSLASAINSPVAMLHSPIWRLRRLCVPWPRTALSGTRQFSTTRSCKANTLMETSGFSETQLQVREAIAKICSNFPDVSRDFVKRASAEIISGLLGSSR